MTRIAMTRFSGMAPKVASRKLATEQASRVRNCKLWSGDLRSIRQPLPIYVPTLAGTKQSLFKLAGSWLSWLTDVDVAEAPIAEDTTNRIYYTGDLCPKVTNETLALVGAGTNYPLDNYQLGVPAPETAPTIGHTGGTGSDTTRSYLYTYVTQWGEESAPGPSAEYTAPEDATWNLTAMDVAPINAGSIIAATYSAGVVTIEVSAKHLIRTGETIDHAGVGGMTDLNGRFVATRIDATHYSVVLTTVQTYTSGGTWTREANLNVASMTKRIYRTVSGLFKYIDEIPASTTIYNDTTADSDAGEELPSTDWDMPPINMKGLLVLPNGIMAGFVDKQLCLSVPNVPYAFPVIYRKIVDTEIVGIKDWGQSIIIGTKGKPYRVIGTHPETMSMARIELEQSCLSKRSMVALQNGVAYASPDGIVMVGAAGVGVVTESLLRKNEWSKYNPSSMIAAQYDDRYYAFYSDAGDNSNESGVVIFDPEEASAHFTLGETKATAVYVDREDDSFYYINDGHIMQWDAGGAEFVSNFLSKIFILPKPVAMKAAKFHIERDTDVTQAEIDAAIAAGIVIIETDLASGALSSDGTFSGSQVNEYTVGGGPYLDLANQLGTPSSLTFKIYGNGELIFTKIVEDEKAFRINMDELYDTLQFEFTTNQVRVADFVIAETMSELART